MRYLLDTNIVFPHLANDQTVTALIKQLANEGITISTITLMEAWQGIHQVANSRATEARYRAFFDTIIILPFDEAVARRGVKLRHDIQQQGGRIRPRALDLLIAATALDHRLELVTRNIADYKDIPSLTLYQP